MPGVTGHRPARWALLLSPALLVLACSGPPDCAQRAVAPSTPASSAGAPSASATPAPTTPREPARTAPITVEELNWLHAMRAAHRAIETDEKGGTFTPGVGRALAETMRGCGRTLARIGTTTKRFQPVATVMKKVCATYDKGARCLDRAATIEVPEAGSRDDRTQNEALTCGFAAISDGSGLYALAEKKSFDIRVAAGDI
jgi:hypothetical protein